MQKPAAACDRLHIQPLFSDRRALTSRRFRSATSLAVPTPGEPSHRHRRRSGHRRCWCSRCSGFQVRPSPPSSYRLPSASSRDPDGLFIHLDRVDDRADIALAGIRVRVLKLFVHQTCKRVDLRNIVEPTRARGPGLWREFRSKLCKRRTSGVADARKKSLIKMSLYLTVIGLRCSN
jgi:hypothetical protein